MTLAKFQESIRQTYYERDSQRGLWATYAWLTEEVGELASAIRRGERESVALEISDVLAWVATLANLLGVELEGSCSRYANGCPKCHQSPCACQFA